MAQRTEIEAWVNPATWENPAAAAHLITLIQKSGSDIEYDWLRLLHEVENAELVAEAIYNAEYGPRRSTAWAQLDVLSHTRARMLTYARAAIAVIDAEFAKAQS